MKRLDKALLVIKSDLEEVAMLIESIEETRIMATNPFLRSPLGHRPKTNNSSYIVMNLND